MAFCSTKKTDETLKYVDKILKPMADVVEQDVNDLECPDSVESLKNHIADMALLSLQAKEREEEAAAEWDNAGTKGKDATAAKPQMKKFEKRPKADSARDGMLNPGDTIDGWTINDSDAPPVIRAAVAPKPKASVPNEDKDFDSRHRKGGIRPQGCPCCDPESLDAMMDNMFARGI